jgi:SWI/SNF-related matrix-associated actin-dependent regulator 1 of chromatin subfamily A
MASGTPLVNNPENVWSLVDAINPYILGGYQGFNNFFCVTVKRPLFRNGKRVMKFGHPIFIKQIVGARNLDILNTVLASSVMIRRTKEQVLPQLPSKTKTVIPVELKLDKGMMDEAEELILNADTSDAVEKAYAKVYKEIGVQKIDVAKQWISDYLSSCSSSLVVAGWHRDVTTALYEEFKKDAVLVIGGCTDKEQSVDLFQKGEKRLLIGNIKAAGTGLTLTKASDMLFVELPFTSSDFDQMCDRIHRIGQTEHVNYYILVAKDTVEEKIVHLLDAKADAAAIAIDGLEQATYSIEDLLKTAVKQMKG